MTVYNFTFPAGTDGRTAVALDALGNPVITAPIYLINGECKAIIDLPAGVYRAKVEGVVADDSYIVQDDATIAASRPQGYTKYEFECNDGATLTANGSLALPFDSGPEGFVAGTALDLPAGLYAVDAFVMFSEPAEQRWMGFRLGGSNDSTLANVAPILIDPDSGDPIGRTVKFTVPLYCGGDNPVGCTINTHAPSDAVSPADIDVQYADFVFYKVS